MFRDRILFHPERFHGHRRRTPFFEGWYFKLVDASEQERWAVIPGIFLSEDPSEEHAFIQVLDGSTGSATYHRFPADSFVAARDSFDLRLGPNRFSASGVTLDLDGEGRRIRGTVELDGTTPWPVTLRSLGAMGPYGWVPMMECNHGVVSLDHGLTGSLSVDGREVDFAGGRGYIEKDWGKAFPAGYVWMQTNHFDEVGTSFFGSIAIIPWLFSAFPGFIVGLWHGGELYRFATYTRAKTDHLEITDDAVRWVIGDRRHRLEVEATRAKGGLLYGPTRERMSDRVGETMLSTVSVRLTTRSGATVFEGTGRNAGLEVHGDLDRLLELQVAER